MTAAATRSQEVERAERAAGRPEFEPARLRAALDEQGYALVPRLLGARDCAALIRLYAQRDRFRSFVDMERHGFGRGDYRYFGAPLPPLVAALRTHLYPSLAAVANQWAALIGGERYPRSLAAFTRECRRAGQTSPTPLLLHYTEGGFNCLHQDRYGEVAFPLQVAVLLSRSVRDRERDARAAEFEGGEFLLTEQRPRQQSRGEAVALARGDAIVFPNAERPVAGKRGHYRANVRHGVSRVHSGRRFTLGLIFHDAR